MPPHYNVRVDHFSRVVPEYVVSNAEIFDRIRLSKLAAELGRESYLALSQDARQTMALEKYPLAMDNFEANTMIRQRHQFGRDVSICDKAAEVLRKGLQEASWDPKDLDFIIVSTVSNTYQNGSLKTPTIAGVIQEAVGAWNAWAYDMTAACSGWIYPVQQATAFIHSGMAKRGAVVNIEMVEYALDYTNEKSSPLLGDVATVTLMSWSEEPGIYGLVCQGNRQGVPAHLTTWGTAPKAYPETEPFLPFSGPTIRSHIPKAPEPFALKGKAVYAEGIREMGQHTESNIRLTKDVFGSDPDWFVYHQANGSMLNKILTGLNIDAKKHLYNIDRFANTAGATIPSVLSEHWDNMKVGHTTSVAVFGGGITSGRVVLCKRG